MPSDSFALPPQEFKDHAFDEEAAFSSPYVPTTRHQTFTVDPPRDQSSYSHFPSKNLDDGDLAPIAYPPPPPEKEIDGLGFWQKILPESMACRLYVLTVLIETTIDLAIEGELLIQVNRHTLAGEQGDHEMPVYLAIFALAHVFQFAMAVDAVYARNTLQFFALTLFNALFLVYAVIQIGEIRGLNIKTSGHIPVNVLTTIIPIVIAIAEIAYVGLGWKIYNEFGWSVYKFLGADRQIKKMYANFQIYECLVKFDVFFWVGFSVQFIFLVLVNHNGEYYITCAALPLSLFLLVEGHLAARHESRIMMYTFMSGCVGAMVYFVYKLQKVLRHKDDPEFFPVWKTLTVFSVIAIMLLIATFIFSLILLQNFGRGLKNSLSKSSPGHNRFASQHHRRAASQNPYRMSIN